MSGRRTQPTPGPSTIVAPASARLAAGLAVVVAAGLLTVASPGAAGASAAPTGVTATTVTVAGFGDSSAYADAQLGARARFDAVNAAGGVHGRRVVFAGWHDDKGLGPNDLAIGRALIRDRVLAAVPVVTPAFAAAPRLAGAHVPVFGWGVSTGFCNNPYAFAITGCIVAPGRLSTFPSTWGRLLDQLLRDRGVGGARGKTAAIVAQHDAGGRQALTAVGAAARAGGFRVVYAQPVVPPPPALPLDYSPYAQAVLTANAGAPADVVFLVVDVTSTVELGRQLRAAGYRGVVTNATTYDPRLVAATAGQTVLTQVAVPEAAPTDPTLAGIVATIRRSAGPVPITQPMLAGYLAADFFVQALRRAGRHVTAASLAATAARLTYTIRGVVGPTRYPAAQRLASPCGALLESTGAAYRLARPYACFQNVDVHTLRPARG